MSELNRRQMLTLSSSALLAYISSDTASRSEELDAPLKSELAKIPGLQLEDRGQFTEITNLDAISDAITKIKSLPFQGIGIISGNVSYQNYFSKLQRLDVAQNARFSFVIHRDVSAVYLVAKEVYIQAPINESAISKIAYSLLDGLSGGPLPKGKRGRSWRTDWWDDNGVAGGPGEAGLTGISGLSYDAPEIYFVFQTLTIQNGLPTSPSLLDFQFNGLPGGNGGKGGDGGDGGNGARGTHAVDKWTLGVPTCKAGPGRGGDSGKPGSGGKGGDAGKGGSGGRIFIICPRSEAKNIAFKAAFEAGGAGTKGQPGDPGAAGVPGGGGALSLTCRDGRPSGDTLQPNPKDFGPGQPNLGGTRGGYFVVYRDNSDLFPF